MKTIKKHKTTRAHYHKYKEMIEGNNLHNFSTGISISRLKRNYNKDQALNTIPLGEWDAMGLFMPIKATMAEKVCILKHIAIHKELGLKPEFTD